MQTNASNIPAVWDEGCEESVSAIWEGWKLLGKCDSCWTQLGMHDRHQRGVTVDRECDSPKGGVKYIRKVCQLVGRCDVHG